MVSRFKLLTAIFFLVFNVCFLNASSEINYKIVKDAINREIKVPKKIKNIMCSGSGCLRLLTYMQAEKLIVGVDDMEKRDNVFDARAYAIANPQYKKIPLIGGFRGFDNPELILTSEPLPDVIFKIYSPTGVNPAELQKKTGIPVVVLKYGDLGYFKNDFFDSLKIIGKVLNKEKRAEDLISFVNFSIEDLDKRTENILKSKKKSCFVGGVAYNGPHGLNSTEPAYSPLKMVNGLNVAFDSTKAESKLLHVSISKEQLLDWDPNIILIDLATLQTENTGNALYEIKNDAVYQELTAVKNGNLYGVLPYNYYSMNFESVIANAYFIGKLLFPDRFKDICPETKADEIYTFFVGKPVYKTLDKTFGGLSFKRISLR
jgi:iron complex transport system substrate-binding protein